MNENRSWVVPLAFVTFAGIFIVAVFLFLSLKGLLEKDPGVLLVSWLTLIFTMCGFGAALTALFIALSQMRDSRTQADIAEMEEIDRRIEHINNCSDLVYHAWSDSHYYEYLIKSERDHAIKAHRSAASFLEKVINIYNSNEAYSYPDFFEHEEDENKFFEKINNFRIFYEKIENKINKSTEQEHEIFNRMKNICLLLGRHQNLSSQRKTQLLERKRVRARDRH